MRYLAVSVDQPPGERNPMHQFLVDSGDALARLLHWERYGPADRVGLFYVEAEEAPYREALTAYGPIEEFELTRRGDGSLYLYVRERVPDRDRAFADAFAQPGLLVVPPVEYRADGTVRVTAVGPVEAVQSAVEAVPAAMCVTVEAVGGDGAGRLDPGVELTQRQSEAVRAAVKTGYYGVPRESGLGAVADQLDCAPGTAGELLRRAERTVMARLVDGGPF